MAATAPAKSFIAIIALVNSTAMVVKIAIPPPSAIALRLCLFSEGRETKFNRTDAKRTTAVSAKDKIKETASRMTNMVVSVAILVAPVNAVSRFQRNQYNISGDSRDK